MRRTTFLLSLAAAALSASACGDPLVVLGDSPGTVRNVVGVGDSAGSRIDTVATRSRFLTLTAVAFNDESKMLYVADRGSNRVINFITTPIGRIFSVTSSGRMQQLLDGGGCSTGGGPCLVEATSMTAAGNTLLIADAFAHRIFALDTNTKTFTSIAGNGAAVNATDGSPAATTSVHRPSGIARAADGTLYVAESGSGRVLRIGTDGVYRVVAGGGTTAHSTSPIPATSVRLAAPAGLALRGSMLYIADRSLSAVFALNLADGLITHIAGVGLTGFSGDGGPALVAAMQSPTDLAIDPTGRILYIADTGNNRVRSITLENGGINTYMGSGSTVYNGNHVAAGAISLKTPVALEIAAQGFLFVVDQGHHVVRRVTIDF